MLYFSDLSDNDCCQVHLMIILVGGFLIYIYIDIQDMKSLLLEVLAI